MSSTSATTVWVIDDDQSIRWVLEKALQKADYQVSSFADASSALDAMADTQPDVLLSDIRMPGMDGIDLLNRLQSEHPDLPVIIMTAHSDLDSAVSAYHSGAFEYLPKPFDVKEVVEQVERANRSRPAPPSVESEVGSVENSEIIGNAPAMQEVFRAIGRLARSNVSVLINGASGTGKELVANALHQHSPRADKPFVALNMAAIPKELMESELFGHEKGAFTGAQGRRIGRFEQADGGTLFLDEIGDMPADTQTRLLRVLADNTFHRVGGNTLVHVDVRIIAATHQNLEQLVADGQFREDLYHRLNVIRIKIPLLKERREDVAQLMEFFLRRSAEELGTDTKHLLPETIEVLQAFDWPGNVRQLENVARWLTVMASGNEVHPEDLPPEVQEQAPEKPGLFNWQAQLAEWARNRFQQHQAGVLNEALPDFERIMINAALEQTGGKRQEAAKLLGWGRNTLTRKIKELEIED
ncbi:MAG: nitrogen regulation protein NR(I) [bacterium]